MRCFFKTWLKYKALAGDVHRTSTLTPPTFLMELCPFVNFSTCTIRHSLWRNSYLFFYSILFYPITLEGRRGTTDEFATIPFHLDLFSAALVELAKSIPVHSLILSSHLFFCLPLFLFPFTVPCRIVFAKPEDLETWPNHLSFHFLTRVRSSSYSPMAAWIFPRTSSLVTWSLYEMFNSLR